MLARSCFVSLVALVSPLFAQDYDGKFLDHPNFDKVEAIAERVAAEAPKELPKWLTKKTPNFSVIFADAEKPLGAFDWPGKVTCGFKTELNGKTTDATITLPLDSLIGDTSLVEPALRRQIFGVTAFQAEMASGVSILDLGERGLENPVIDAIAAHWAGDLEREIDYALLRRLEDMDATMGLVTDLEFSDNGAKLMERPEGDLTVLMLASYLGQKNDKKLAKLFQSITRKQPLKQGVEKAAGKKVDRLNGELQKALTKRLKARYVKPDHARYEDFIGAYEAEDWSTMAEETEKFSKVDLIGPNLEVFAAIALAGISDEVGAFDEGDASVALLRIAASRAGSTPHAVLAQERLAVLFEEVGNEEMAREAWTRLGLDFGWQPGWAERAELALSALDK